MRLDPVTPPAREISAAPSLAFELAIVLGAMFGGLIVYALPDIQAWIAGQAPAVHARALNGCHSPTEHEQLHIIVTHRDGRLVSECMYVGTRGTYTKGR